MVRERIKNAYRGMYTNYEDLLEACSSVEEDFLLKDSSSRVNFFKRAVQFDETIRPLKKQKTSWVQEEEFLDYI